MSESSAPPNKASVDTQDRPLIDSWKPASLEQGGAPRVPSSWICASPLIRSVGRPLWVARPQRE